MSIKPKNRAKNKIEPQRISFSTLNSNDYLEGVQDKLLLGIK